MTTDPRTTGVIFGDELMDTLSRPKKTHTSTRLTISFDYSPSSGRVLRIDPIIRYRMITDLSLVGHQLENILSLEILVRLVRLNLSWNSITSLLPLTNLVKLEYLNLSHNLILHLPDSIAKLSALKILHLGFNPISDRSEFFRLARNLNLSNLDLEGSPVSCEAESLLMAVSILPQLTILNRKIISSDVRRKSQRRFCHPLSGDPEQCTTEVTTLQLQNEKLLAQQRGEIAAIKSDCEARKRKWKNEVHELRAKFRSLQIEMQAKDESIMDGDRQAPIDLSLINHFSEAIQRELLRQRELYKLTGSVPSAELPIKQCYLTLVQTFSEIKEEFSLPPRARGQENLSAEFHEVVESSPGPNEIARAKLRVMRKEKSSLIVRVHEMSERIRELEIKSSHEQELLAESRATILDQQQIIYDLERRIQEMAASNEELDLTLMSQEKKTKSLLNSQLAELDTVRRQSADRDGESRAELKELQSALQQPLRKEKRLEKRLRKVLAYTEELQEALAEARKHNTIVLEENRAALEQLTEAKERIVHIEGLRSATDHSFALLATKFNALQESQARKGAAARRLDSSSFELTRRLRDQESVNESLRGQLSTLDHIKSKCLDKIASKSQQIRLLQHRLLDAESQLGIQDAAQLELKQEKEELLRQLTEVTTKFDQCQTKLSALENSEVSAERYSEIVTAHQRLSQEAQSAAKSHKIALDSMQQKIAALGKRNTSLHRNYEDLQQSHKAAQIEHESQMNELRQQLDASIESSRRFASESSATSAQTELLKHQVLSQESKLLSHQSKLSSAQESYERKLRQAQTLHKERIDELERVRSDLTEQVNHFQEEVSGLKSELQAETANGSRTLEQVTQKFESALAQLATKDQVIARLQGEAQRGGKASRGISRMQRFLRTTSKSGLSPSKVLHGLVDRLNDVSRVLGMDSLRIDEWEQRVACEVSSQLVVSVTPENETLRTRHKAIFDTVRQVMLSFPIAREEVDVGSPDRLEEELLQLKSMVELVRGLFDERERHIQDLVSMIDAQHQAVMSMSQSRDQPQASTHTLRKLQHVVATDSAGRKLMLSSSRP